MGVAPHLKNSGSRFIASQIVSLCVVASEAKPDGVDAPHCGGVSQPGGLPKGGGGSPGIPGDGGVSQPPVGGTGGGGGTCRRGGPGNPSNAW